MFDVLVSECDHMSQYHFIKYSFTRFIVGTGFNIEGQTPIKIRS